MEAANAKSAEFERKKELSEVLLQLAQETEALVMKERHHFSPILKKWHSIAGAVAAMVLHTCFGKMLKQYVRELTSLTTESVQVLQKAGKLEKVIVQMMVEDSSECEDGGKTLIREMVPYDVDSVILSLLGKWIDESLHKGKECLQRAKETEVSFAFMILIPLFILEGHKKFITYFVIDHRILFITFSTLLFQTWNPKSKSELHAQSAAELMKLAAITVEEFFQVPIVITEDLVQDLADGLENLFQDYMKFVASCGK